MNASERRRTEDLRRLRELSTASNGRIVIENVDGDPPRSVTLVLRYRSAKGEDFPPATVDQSRVRVDFPSRYPMIAPKATILTPIFHPNVYTSGLICLGDTWMPTETLDALVRRIIRLITFDPLVSGGEPPANQTALRWYKRLRKQSPNPFPTDTVTLDKSSGKPASRVKFGDAAPERVEVACPACPSKLRLPPARSGIVRCPSCGERFTAKT